MQKEIINHFTWLANKLSESNTYESWTDELRVQELKDGFRTFYTSLINNKLIDLEKLTIEEAKELRFRKWDDEHPDLWLFPLWIVPLIPEGMTVYNLNGEARKYEKDKFDNDIRYGCVAYGVMLKEN